VKKYLKMVVGIGIMAVALMLAGPVAAQEHPEHPSTKPAAEKAEEPAEHPEHPAEHPEHPSDDAKSAEMTMDELSAAIKDFVKQDSDLKGGMFFIYDAAQKTVLQLSLAKVHEEKLASLGDGVYFACADFNSHDDHVYDLDVFMEKGEHGNIVTTDVSVHKKDGVARYTWSESDGVWSKTATGK
jgi:hypothetical protein